MIFWVTNKPLNLFVQPMCVHHVYLWSSWYKSLQIVKVAFKKKKKKVRHLDPKRQEMRDSRNLLFPTLTALLLNEPSSSVCRPRELGGLPREFWRRRVGGIPRLGCSQSSLASALLGTWEGVEYSFLQPLRCINTASFATGVNNNSRTVAVLIVSGTIVWAFYTFVSLWKPPSPGRADQCFHLFNKVSSNHVLAAGDPQCVCHGFNIKRGVQHQDGTVNSTV